MPTIEKIIASWKSFVNVLSADKKDRILLLEVAAIL